MALTTEQTRLRAAALTIARRFGVGVTSWTVTAPASGLGGAPTSIGTVTGYAVQGRLGGIAQAAAGTPVEPMKWYLVTSGGDTLSPHQQIASASYTFQVIGEAAEGLGVYEVERV